MKEITLLTDEEKNLVIAGLLHDIGKLVQRTKPGNKTPHQILGKEFLEKYVKDEKILKLIEHHHYKREGKDPPSEIKELLEYLIQADVISASMRDDEKETDKSYYETILKKIVDSPFDYYTEDEIETNKNKLPPVHLMESNLWEDYLLREIKEITDVKNYPTIEAISKTVLKKVKDLLNETFKEKNMDKFLCKLDNSLKLTLTLYPSSGTEKHIYIPLYHHMRDTAAIALCLYRSNNKEKPFLLIKLDLSGIQKFITNFKTTEDAKGTINILRGRSTFLQLLMESVLLYIRKEMKLPVCNILMKSGGVAYIVAPNNEENKKHLEKIKVEVNNFLFNNFRTQIYVAFVYTEASQTELQNQIIWEKLNILAQHDKKKKFFYEIKEGGTKLAEKEMGIKEDALCNYCQNIKEDTCVWCQRFIDLGKKMKKDLYINFFFGTSQASNLVFHFGNTTLSLEISDKKHPKSDLTYYTKLRIDELVEFGDYWYPLIHISEIKTINEMCEIKINENSTQHVPLGVLRMDVDNLGEKLFKHIPKHKDNTEKYVISKLTLASALLDLFFSKRLEKIINEPEYKGLVYPVFAGGDDILVIGRFDKIIDVAIKIKKDFEKFVSNKLTISAGITILNHKIPITRTSTIAEEYIRMSKNKGRNKITIQNVTMDWDDNEKIIVENSEKIKTFLKNKKISKSCLINIKEVIDAKVEEIPSNKTVLTSTYIINPEPHIAYIIKRNVRDIFYEEIVRFFIGLSKLPSKWFDLMMWISLLKYKIEVEWNEKP